MRKTRIARRRCCVRRMSSGGAKRLRLRHSRSKSALNLERSRLRGAALRPSKRTPRALLLRRAFPAELRPCPAARPVSSRRPRSLEFGRRRRNIRALRRFPGGVDRLPGFRLRILPFSSDRELSLGCEPRKTRPARRHQKRAGPEAARQAVRRTGGTGCRRRPDPPRGRRSFAEAAASGREAVQAVSHPTTLRSSRLNSTPIRWTERPRWRYLSA